MSRRYVFILYALQVLIVVAVVAVLPKDLSMWQYALLGFCIGFYGWIERKLDRARLP